MEQETFIRYLQGGVQLNSSDIHFKVGSPPMYRISKALRSAREEPLTPQDTLDICRFIIKDDSIITGIEEMRDYDTSFSLPGYCRFRVNIFRQ